MKILVVGVCDEPQSTNTFMVTALKKLGHEVDAFNYRTVIKQYDDDYVTSPIQQMNKALGSYCTQQKFDLIILCKTDTVYPSTINYLSQITKTFYFYMDPLGTAKNMNAHLLAKNATYVSSTTTEVLEHFQQTGSKNTTRIIEGVDIEMYKPVHYAKIYDIVFIGSRTFKREKHIAKLKDFGYNVTVFGNGWPDYVKALPPVYNEDLVKVINQSKIVLNFVHGNSYSDRVTLTLAAGGFLLSEHANDLWHEYAIGEELLTWDSLEDLYNLIEKYLWADDERNAFVKKGTDRACLFTWERTCKQILEAASDKDI